MIKFPVLPPAEANPPLRQTRYGWQDEITGNVHLDHEIVRYTYPKIAITNEQARNIIDLSTEAGEEKSGA